MDENDILKYIMNLNHEVGVVIGELNIIKWLLLAMLGESIVKYFKKGKEK